MLQDQLDVKSPLRQHEKEDTLDLIAKPLKSPQEIQRGKDLDMSSIKKAPSEMGKWSEFEHPIKTYEGDKQDVQSPEEPNLSFNKLSSSKIIATEASEESRSNLFGAQRSSSRRSGGFLKSKKISVVESDQARLR